MKFEFEGSYDAGRRARCVKAPDMLPQLVGMVGEVYFSGDGNIDLLTVREIRTEHALRDWLFDNAHALIRIAREKAES